MSHWGSLSSSFSLDCFLNVCFALKPGLAGVDEVGMDVVGLGAVSLAHPRIIFFHLIFSGFLCLLIMLIIFISMSVKMEVQSL